MFSHSQLGGPQQRLAWEWLARLLQRTAEAAPGPTEANLSEQMRKAAAAPRGATAEVMGRYMPEVLQVRTKQKKVWGGRGCWVGRGWWAWGNQGGAASATYTCLLLPSSPYCTRRTPSNPPSHLPHSCHRCPHPLVQLVRAARERFPMAALHAEVHRGVMAWSTKLHYLGRVAGLAESAEVGDMPASSVPLECAKRLAGALRHRHTDRAVADV